MRPFVKCAMRALKLGWVSMARHRMTARKWIELRRTVRVWRDALRVAAGEDRAAKSAEFLARRKSSPSNVKVDLPPKRGGDSTKDVIGG